MASSSAAVVTTWLVNESGRLPSPGYPARWTTPRPPTLREDVGDCVGVGAVDEVPRPVEPVGRRDPVDADDVVAAVGEADR